MMARYIDADALREYWLENGVNENVYNTNDVLNSIDYQPTADVVEVKHGEWKQGVPYVCSICGKPAPDEKNTSEKYSCWTSPYCPNCGAKMTRTPKERGGEK